MSKKRKKWNKSVADQLIVQKYGKECKKWTFTTASEVSVSTTPFTAI